MRRLAATVVGVLLVLPARASGQDSAPLPRHVTVASVSVAAVAMSYGEVGGEIGAHIHPRDVVRVSVWGFGTVALGQCGCGHLAGYVGAEYALRRADDLSVWLGASFGPMALLHGTVDAGASAVLSLDIALPITRKLAFDVLVRAGVDVRDLGSSELSAGPFLYGGFGVTWDFDSHHRQPDEEPPKSAEYKR